MLSTIQFVYKDMIYNDETIQFNKLNDLKHKLRDSFLLPEEDFNDKEIEEALKESKGDIYRSFARLMSISE